MTQMPRPSLPAPWRHLPALALGCWLGMGAVHPASAQDYDKGYAALTSGDFATALRELSPLAETGDAAAQFLLGVLHYNGSGVPKDDAIAEDWFLKSAEQGDAAAQFALGVFYNDATGGRQDLERSRHWLLAAAEQGHAKAQSMLGYVYQNGLGVPKDMAEAMRWYLRAAEQGDLTAQKIAALRYSVGDGVPKDAVQARKWRQRAADQGDAFSQYDLGRSYEDEGDMVQARAWYLRAAEQNDAKSELRLGFLLYHGLGGDADPAQAALWYRRAAEQGEAKAQAQLGFLYETGQGVAKDTAEAAAWTARAVAGGVKTVPERDLFLWQQRLRTAEAHGGPDSPEVLEPLWNLGRILTSNLDFLSPPFRDEAREIYRRGTELSRRVLGPDNPRTLGFAGSYAVRLHSEGRDDEALAFSRDTVARARRVLGPTDEKTLTYVGTLAAILAATGDQDESYRILLDGMAIASRSHGPESWLVKTALGTRLVTLNTDKPNPGLISIVQAAAQEDRQAAGRTSPKYLYLMGKNAELLEASGREAEALEARREIVAAYQERLLLGSTMDELMRRAVITEARQAGIETVLRIRAARDPLINGSSGLTVGTEILTGAALDAELASEAFHAVQLGQNGAALAVARSTARLALKDAALQQGFAAFEAAQKRVLALTDASNRDIDRRTAGEAVDATEILATQDQREAAVREVNALADSLATEFPRFFDMLAPRPMTVAELRGTEDAQPLLGGNEALILLMPPKGEMPGIVWAVSRERIAWAPIAASEAELREDLTHLHAMLDGRGATRGGTDTAPDRGAFNLTDSTPDSAGFDRDFAHRLYLKLFGDPAIEAVIGDKAEWILAPQGLLLSLPFAPLVTEAPTGGRAGDADPAALRATAWLGTHRALSVTPSVSSLRAVRRSADTSAPHADFPFFGLGDPAFGGGAGPDRGAPDADLFRSAPTNPDLVRRLPRLPGTRHEIEALASVFGASGDALLLGSDASETALAAAQESGILPRARVVVMATHGLMAGAFAGLSEPALALSPPEAGTVAIASDLSNSADDPWIDDGLLTASEVTRLTLDAEWVILSACDTAAGEDQTPDAEGLSGLARAFFYAGARSLLVSHWPVRDDAASKLTPWAVSEAEQAHVSHAEALRRAMQRVMEDSSTDAEGHSLAHPSAWAPFQVTGVDRDGA